MIPPDDVVTSIPRTPLRRLRELLDDGSLARAVEQKRLGESLAKVRQEIAQYRLSAHLDALLPAAGTVTISPAQRTELEHRLGQIAGVAKGIQSAQSRDDLRSLPEKIRFAVTWRESIQGVVGTAWLNWIERSFIGPKRLSDLLQRFSGTEGDGLKLQQSASEGLALKSHFPPTEEQAARARELVASQQRLLVELEQQEETADLLRFLRRVLDDSATLEHVTPKLADWLRQHNALGLLKVKL